MKKLFQKFRRSEKGVTLVEYGIALVLAITVGGTLLTVLGAGVNAQMTEANTVMTE